MKGLCGLEGKGGRGWADFKLKLRKVLETFQISLGNGQLVRRSEVPLSGFPSFRLKMYSTAPLVPMVHDEVVC